MEYFYCLWWLHIWYFMRHGLSDYRHTQTKSINLNITWIIMHAPTNYRDFLDKDFWLSFSSICANFSYLWDSTARCRAWTEWRVWSSLSRKRCWRNDGLPGGRAPMSTSLPCCPGAPQPASPPPWIYNTAIQELRHDYVIIPCFTTSTKQQCKNNGAFLFSWWSVFMNLQRSYPRIVWQLSINYGTILLWPVSPVT